jgi:transcriptional regulator GlxA family with amidase domain
LPNGLHGRRIAQTAIHGTSMKRIARVIQSLKSKLAEPVRVEELAEMTKMSPSSFHFHFKPVTAMSPLQYHKRLRLLEARRSSAANIPACLARPLSAMSPIFGRTGD